jgi:hypothetical protein
MLEELYSLEIAHLSKKMNSTFLYSSSKFSKPDKLQEYYQWLDKTIFQHLGKDADKVKELMTKIDKIHKK